MATRITGERLEEIPVSELRDGDVILVRPGQSVPADGIVRDGASDVNEAMITGESRPVKKQTGAAVIAGTVNGAGALRVEVTGTGERTALAGIMRLVEQAQTSRSRAQALADRAAFWLTVIAIGTGLVTLLVWLGARANEPAFAIERFVTVLVIACPHALGLAVPLVIAISTAMGAHSGLLVRDRRGLEEARNLNVVVFDKTGTLTRGEFGVVDVQATEGQTAENILRLAAAVERDSEHPIARGIVRTATERKVVMPRSEAFEAIAGKGAVAQVEGRRLFVGGPALLKHLGLQATGAILSGAERASAAGRAAIYFCEQDRILGVLVIADVVKDESRDAVKRLQSGNIVREPGTQH
jgi:Cu2+-exporting ATPase